MARLPVESSTGRTVTLGGREILAFAGCNYLGLGYHPEVLRALERHLKVYGVSTTASRETTGNTVSHEALERELAAFVGQEACILTAEGYTANFAACQALAPELGVALLDAKAHRSLRNAAMAAGMQVFEYEHCSARSAAHLVRQYADTGVAILTDSVFAADGAIAPLRELLGELPARRSCLIVDDCHGFCVLGPSGRGEVAHEGLDAPRILITTTLAKGLGCYGGGVLGPGAIVGRLRQQSGVYRGSTPIPPAIAEACRAAIGVVRRDPEIVVRLRENISTMRGVLGRLGLALPPEFIPIFTFVLDPVERMQAIHDQLLEAGVLAPLIEYPGGPGPRYFRVVVSAAHSAEDIRQLGQEFARAMTR